MHWQYVLHREDTDQGLRVSAMGLEQLIEFQILNADIMRTHGEYQIQARE